MTSGETKMAPLESTRKIVRILQDKGVVIPSPESVSIAQDVDPDRISGNGVTLYPQTALSGENLLICDQASVGEEGPAVVKNCQVGPNARLKGGFFHNAVFLEKASMGMGAHVREGCILEEEAGCAHTVGLKQTILFPFVTLGSLINFCDCMMTGGTSRKNHSEVGSSFIHFNFTPNQDKATASLFGDVPRGVMLKERPVFLGGQGGVVGPCCMGFGTVTAAGSIIRKDEERENRLIFDVLTRTGSVPFRPGRYTGINRIIRNNIRYIANLYALLQWYTHVRSLFVNDSFSTALYLGLVEKVNMGISERIKRLGQLAGKLEAASSGATTPPSPAKLFVENWHTIREILSNYGEDSGDVSARDMFIRTLEKTIPETGKSYIPCIQSLSEETRNTGTTWLAGIVNGLTERILDMISAPFPPKESA